MREEPAGDLGIGPGVDGDLVAALGVFGVAGFASGGGDFVEGAAGFGDGDDAVVFTVEDPEGDVLEFCGLAFGHAAADGDGGGEAWLVDEPFEGAVAAHRGADEVEASGVDGLGFEKVVEEGDDSGEGGGGFGVVRVAGGGPGGGVGPHFAGRALGGHDVAGVFFLTFGGGPHACPEGSGAGEDLGLVVGAFSGAAVEDDDEGEWGAGFFRGEPAVADGAVLVGEGAGFEASGVFAEEAVAESLDGGELGLVLGGGDDLGFGEEGGGKGEEGERNFHGVRFDDKPRMTGVTEGSGGRPVS